MKTVCFRVDSSKAIGTGHLMRCLTLARKLRKKNFRIFFISRKLKGNLIELCKREKFSVFCLPRPSQSNSLVLRPSDPAHSRWLEVSWEMDAKQTQTVLKKIKKPDYLIVDHYALDARWEKEMRTFSRKIMAIDDLADRPHDCDILLDQNLYQNYKKRYDKKIPKNCLLLLGPQYALINEKILLAKKKLRRPHRSLKKIHLFMGGVDQKNATLKMLKILKEAKIDGLKKIDVFIGKANENKNKILSYCKVIQNATPHTSSTQFANRMAQADLSLGACGSTTWDRLCLGIPSALVSVADNQIEAAQFLHKKKYIFYLGKIESIKNHEIIGFLKTISSRYSQTKTMCLKGLKLVDGLGTQRVVKIITKILDKL